MDNLIIENAKIFFKNFSGEETRYNREGNRNFCVEIDASHVDNLIADGWNVRKSVSLRDEDEEPTYYIPVTVSFKNIPPKIYLVTSLGKEPLDEETVGQIDHLDIKNVDLSIRPYPWEVNGKSGVKAYLKTMYVTIEEDEFASKYVERD